MAGVRRFKRHGRGCMARLMTIKADASRLRFCSEGNSRLPFSVGGLSSLYPLLPPCIKKLSHRYSNTSTMSPSNATISNDYLIATLEQERQAIYNTNFPEAEQHRQWSRRKAEVEAYLAADHLPSLKPRLSQSDETSSSATSHV